MSDLKIRSTDENKRILECIKNKVICNEGKSIDNIVYADLIREIQKETKIPKKNIRHVLEKIYKTYTGGK
jgi:DNA-directed RNA polymerase delta subunit